MLRIICPIDVRAELGESPLCDVAEQRLYWIDSLEAKAHSDVAYVTSVATVKAREPRAREAGALLAVYGLGVRGLPEPRSLTELYR